MQSPYMFSFNQREKSIDKKGGAIIDKALKKVVEKKLSLLNKTFKQKELDLKVYQTANEEVEEKIEVIICPKCNSIFTLELKNSENGENTLNCPSCKVKIRKEERDDTK